MIVIPDRFTKIHDTGMQSFLNTIKYRSQGTGISLPLLKSRKIAINAPMDSKVINALTHSLHNRPVQL